MANHTTRERLEEVERLREQALHSGSPAAVDRQREKGRMLARERMELMIDPGSFAGGAVYSPAMTDFVMMVEDGAHMFITGPEVVRTVTGEDVSFEELGGARTHAERSGVAHFTAPDERALLEDCRYLLSFLPQWNGEQPAWEPPDDPVDREDESLDTLIPDESTKPYDMHDVIGRVVDDGQFCDVHSRWAEN